MSILCVRILRTPTVQYDFNRDQPQTLSFSKHTNTCMKERTERTRYKTLPFYDMFRIRICKVIQG